MSSLVRRAYLAAGAVAVGAFFLLPDGGAGQSAIYAGLTLSAALVISLAVRAYRPIRPHPWFVLAAGCVLSINTDAHSPEEMDFMPYGVDVARRAWATKRDVINCMTWDELKAFVSRKR